MGYKEYTPFIILALFAILSFFILKPFLIAIFLGALLAYISFPLYTKLRSKINSQNFSAFIVCFVVLLVVLVSVVFLTKTLIQESYLLFIVGQQKLATGIFTNCHNSFCQSIQDLLNTPEIGSQLQSSLETVTDSIIKKGSSLLIALPKLFVNLFVIFFTMFYFLRDGKKLQRTIGKYLGMNRTRYNFIIQRSKEVLQGIVYGYLVVAVAQGALAALGFFLFGISSPLLWGVVVALLALIPLLGSSLIWLPASILLFLEGIFQDSTILMVKGVGLLIYNIVFVASLDNYIKPKLMSQKAKINPAVIMLGIFGGIFVFGAIGVLVGPLILSLTIIFFDVYVLDNHEKVH